MTLLGESILDAIDWVQDRLTTTRPLAERTLFSLLAAKTVQETDNGFMLMEAEDNVKQHHARVHHRSRPRSGRQRMKRRARYHHRMEQMDPDAKSEMDAEGD